MRLEYFTKAARGEYVQPDTLTAELIQTINEVFAQHDPGSAARLMHTRNLALALPLFAEYGANIEWAAQRLVAMGDTDTKLLVLTLPLRDHLHS